MTRESLPQRVANLEMLVMHMQRDAEEMNKAFLRQARQVDQLQRLVQRLSVVARDAPASPPSKESASEDGTPR
jgi:uncharacterized coiled-coil protein SlyX